ncbi:MAG: ATP-binding protein [Hyphomicrobiales bacterium]
MKTITSDFIEEPDQLGSFANLQDFFDRQTQFATALKNDRVAVKFVTEQGQTVDETRDVRRTELSDLPFVFWFQNLVGLIAMLIGGWIFALRREIAVVSLLVLGVGLQISATAAAVYGSRQLAIEGDFFSTLSNLNHLGSAIFGTALVAMFMMFPRQIIRPVWLLVPVFVFGLFHLSDTFYWTAEPLFIIAIPLQLLVAIVFGVIQFRLSRNEPLDRAGLRWFSLTTFTGCLLFVALSILPGPLGLTDTTFLSQGYAFGFFSFIHIGLALGVSRFRLFALDKFAYHVWLWIGGAALIFLVDFGLLIWLRNQPWASLAIALFVSSFLYFPLRQVLINRLLTPKTPSIVGKVPQVVSVGLSPTLKSRNEKWDDLLRDIFEPASDIQILEIAPEVGKLAENGLALDIPIVKEMKGRRLRYAASGRRLFNSTDLELVRTITHMHSVVVESRESYETGVTQERDRISRDVHDNIGAQLLTALHTPEESRKDEMLRDTLSDLRTIVNEGFQTEHALTDILLDIRNEIADRLELLSITLDWPVIDKVNPNNPTVSYVFANTLRSIIREITSNTIKYANADEITVRIDWTTKHLDLEMQDNGEGFDPQTVQRGNGLRNIFDRTDSVGGQCGVDSSSKGTVFKIRLPVVKIPSRQMEVTQT